MKVKLNRKALVDLALRSEGTRNLVEREGSKRAAALGATIGAENVATHNGGNSRARYTIRRLESVQEEVKDGKLSRLLGGA